MSITLRICSSEQKRPEKVLEVKQTKISESICQEAEVALMEWLTDLMRSINCFDII